MNNRDRNIREKVKEWISFAEDDLRMALCARQLKSNVPYRLIAFHAQQCAEKYLKAYLVFRNVDFPYTHSIATLMKLCGKDIPWIEKIQDADLLTPYVITARYPDVERKVTKPESIKAITLAKQVRRQVRTALSQLGVNLSK
jgi:HEPN domain-containing protein